MKKKKLFHLLTCYYVMLHYQQAYLKAQEKEVIT